MQEPPSKPPSAQRTPLADASYEELAASVSLRLGKDRDKVRQQLAEMGHDEQQLEEKRKNLEELEARISSISDGINDVVELNVGGEIMCTTRAVLRSAEGSLLAGMFSGSFDDGQQRDKEGRVFLDHDPQLFARVLSHLRLRRIATPDAPAPLPHVPEDLRAEYDMMVKYFGLETFMYGDIGCVNICQRIAELSGISQGKLQTSNLVRIVLSSTGGVPSVNHEEILSSTGFNERALENSYGAHPNSIQIVFLKHRVRVEGMELRAKVADVVAHMSPQWQFQHGNDTIQMQFPFSRNEPATGRLETAGLGASFSDTIVWTFPRDFCLEHIVLWGHVMPK
jgi:hypothetical protein